ncbi:DNA-directed RNA polymerase subunit alpha [Candidatus Kryptobacter tengchongensis]|uniref:DNA-directed RNA polymerase subunit alpha n=1 Tax=Kryptobacter tengchongensis TaxID=1643429 RepID=A0A656D6Z0_KRYT1|nr:DNA-directed RNA polymerase subunit alpha [Candidatus Kryptobacter tengchongensis]CUS98250.1 DNA-directed RNA polymerase subunit alpha [Candidatus Kryptobacter tengchongensis]CUT01967.1 DNA-directed RNA polymerase subunit alpha [Candidatus Kryptobacter tengchongensis]CUU08430.1 DNA-directed RNA polymerase subunit alpha [Candidatus Kryptobacter tengchongensis]CUU08921.1 DNA-directed RNA polymerase subunit alpha [Candidatus Kryptobacter tengchongensis]
MLNISLTFPENVVMDEATYSNTFGRFIIQPLERGYGVTIGNALRRVLLSSIPGYAFIAVKIEGVLHEFSTIPGVVEDVTDIVLNLKGVRFKLIDKSIKKVNVLVKGPGKFKAGDIQKQNSGIEILNPEHHIAEITGNTEFEMDLWIGYGKGYVPAEELEYLEPAPPVTPQQGIIMLDAIFTPIKNVRYFIENVRLKQKGDYEKLTLEIETDGSIAPDDALVSAAKILKEHFEIVIELHPQAEPEPIKSTEEGKAVNEKDRIRKILKTPIEELFLSMRAFNILKTNGLNTIGDIVRYQEHQLLSFKNLGRTSLNEIKKIIEGYGLHFGFDVDKYLKES